MRGLIPAIYSFVSGGIYRTETPAMDSAYDATLSDDAYLDTTVTDYSGMGRLGMVAASSDQLATDLQVGVNVDASGEVNMAASETPPVNENNAFLRVASNYVGLNFGGLEFSTSLVVRVRNISGVDAVVSGSVVYAHASEEKERLVIKANQELPNRNYTYDHDVLVIFHKSGSSSIYHPKGDPIALDKRTLKAYELILNKDLNGPKYKAIPSTFNGQKKIILGGIKYNVDIDNGNILSYPTYKTIEQRLADIEELLKVK